MKGPRIESNDALIVVDVQNDFCPGGALPVEHGDEVVPVVNRWIAEAKRRGAKIVVSRDWHPPGHCSFRAQGGEWPEHCLQHKYGAEFHPQLDLPPDAQIISKGTSLDEDNYSAFDGTGLAEQLQSAGVSRLWIGGLALDVCVRATALDACDAGFEVHLIKDATRPVDVEDGKRALREMQEAGAIMVEGDSSDDG